MTNQPCRSTPRRWLSVSTLLLAAAVTAPGCAPFDGGPPDDGGTNGGNGDGNGNGMDVPGQPLATFTTANFSGSGNCAACHNQLADQAGNDVSIATDWRATMMANAARDPFFLASVAAEVAHAPHLRDTIEDLCAKCHMPMARTQAVAGGASSVIFADGFLDDANPLHAAAMEGVSCTLCHQIQDDFLADPEASYSGNYVIDTAAAAPDRAIFGPFPQPQVPELMQSAVGFTPAFAAHIFEPGLCATCHTLFTPTLNDAGEVVGMFPEQTPYLEWRHSEFGDGNGSDQTCQDCHMPVAEAPAAISAVPTGLDPRDPFYRHIFVGGNVFMLRMLRDNVDELGLTASTQQFRRAVELTQAHLQDATADLAIASVSLDGGLLSATLEISNCTGHKFPTSFPSRRAWIHLSITDAGGAVIFESGAPQGDGSIAGNAADASSQDFEPHYDLISANDQVQIYEAIMADVNGEVTYTLLRGDRYAKDNRLLPRGFDKTTAGADIAVHGQAAGDDDFVGGSDRVTYEIDVSAAGGPFTVTADLLYESLALAFAQHLFEVDDPEVARFEMLYDDADKTPTLVASDSRIVP